MEDSTSPSSGKPAAVTKAVTLLLISLAISVVSFLWVLSLFTQMDVGISALLFFFSSLFNVWLIYNINEGRNWARITFLVLFILGLLLYSHKLIQLLSVSFVCGGLSITRIVLQIVALSFLFGRTARPWFWPVETDTPMTPDDINRNS
jgi:hypothetical protein